MTKLEEKIVAMIDTEIDYSRGEAKLVNPGERSVGALNPQWLIDLVCERTGQPRKRVEPRVHAALETHPRIRVVPPHLEGGRPLYYAA